MATYMCKVVILALNSMISYPVYIFHYMYFGFKYIFAVFFYYFTTGPELLLRMTRILNFNKTHQKLILAILSIFEVYYFITNPTIFNIITLGQSSSCLIVNNFKIIL